MIATAESKRVVRLELTCCTPPYQAETIEPVEFGLQDRQQAIHFGQLQTDGSIFYAFDVTALRVGETAVRFQSPLVHGPATAPFLYLSVKLVDVAPSIWLRRLKISLASLTWESIATGSEAPCFVAAISGMGSGTVPLLGDGWVQPVATN